MKSNFRKMVSKVAVSAAILLVGASAGSPINLQAQYQDAEAFVTTANLNLRSGPSTDHSRLYLIPQGSTVNVHIHNPGDFSRIEFQGMHGYVSSEFIAPIGQAPLATTPAWDEPNLGTSSFETNTFETSSQGEVNGDLEMLAWSYIREHVAPQGSTMRIYDVWTSMVYYVTNFSNGSHADVVPLSRADTEIHRATFGHRNTWDPRPVIVTVNGRNIPAAINGMPHGGANHIDNGMIGHVCLHFYGSRTHNGNRSYEADMQATVRQAFNSR